MKYRTIVADPPWDHSDGTGVNVNEGRVTGLPYRTMSTDEIAALPVKGLADNVDADAHLYLWTTSRYLRDAFDIIRVWGFVYVATLVWCKASRGFAPGGLFQNNVEFILFCRCPLVRPEVLRLTSSLADLAERAGISRAEINRRMNTSDMAGWWLSRLPHRCVCPTNDQWRVLREIIPGAVNLDALVGKLNAEKGRHTPQGSPSRWFQWPRQAHSQKPEAFLDLVEQVSPGPYLEMFARRARFGWDYWGDQSLGTAELPVAT